MARALVTPGHAADNNKTAFNTQGKQGMTITGKHNPPVNFYIFIWDWKTDLLGLLTWL